MKCNKKCSGMSKLAKLLVIIGGLNWGLVGLAGFFDGGNWNVVNLLLGSVGWLESLVYLLVGLSALMLCSSQKGRCNKAGIYDMTGGMNNNNSTE